MGSIVDFEQNMVQQHTSLDQRLQQSVDILTKYLQSLQDVEQNHYTSSTVITVPAIVWEAIGDVDAVRKQIEMDKERLKNQKNNITSTKHSIVDTDKDELIAQVVNDSKSNVGLMQNPLIETRECNVSSYGGASGTVQRDGGLS